MSSTSPHHDAENPPRALEFYNGKKMAMFSPRQLSVIWGNDTRYWKMPPKEGHIIVAAELLQVCWLEVSGSIPIGSALNGTKYKISFTISLKSDAFGWNNCPVYVMAKFGKKGRYFWKKTMLPASSSGAMDIPLADDLVIEAKDVSPSNANDTIYFGLYEVWSGKWKGGLQIHKATVQEV